MASVTRGINEHNDCIEFVDVSGKRWLMTHRQDCCESCEIVDICGDLSDLTGAAIGQAEIESNYDSRDSADEFSWAFYKLGTIKGFVTIRWEGLSNGYYSEEVEFLEVVG